MCENCITVRSATIMLRCLALLSAGDDKSYKSALAYLAKLEAGELGAISERTFSEGIKMQSPPSNNGSYLTQFIELQQYLKGSFFNELGLRANYNMKREAIGQGESTLDADSILPLCDNMLKCRREDIQAINSLFGTDISVDFSSAWLENHLESAINIISQLNESGVLGGVAGLGQDGNSLGEVGGNDEGSLGEVGELNEHENIGIGGDNSGNTGNNENGNNSAGEKIGGNGNLAERSGNETENSGESGKGESDESGVGETGGENNGGDVGTDEGSERPDEEEINKVKEELNDNELTFVEGAVEVVNDKISQLVAAARKGDLDD